MARTFHHAFLIQLMLSILFTGNTWAQSKFSSNALELNYLEPTSYFIKNIHVTGTRSLAPEALLAITGLKVGDSIQIPGYAVSEAIKKLWQQKLIEDVVIYASEVIDGRVALTIAIKETPRLSSYFFEGIKPSEEKELVEQVKLVKGKIITNQLLKNTQKSLQKYLASQGYLDAAVTITSLPDETMADYSQLKIKINKGKKFIIRKILFKGNEHIDDKVLKAQLQHTQEQPRFTLFRDIAQRILTLQPFRKGGLLWRLPSIEETMVYLRHHVIPFSSKLIQAKYEEDKKRLLSYYQTQGYRDVAVVEDTIYRQTEGLLDVQIRIEEGKQYRIKSIKWIGNYSYEDDMLKQILAIQPGDIYNPELIRQRLYLNPTGKDVASLYMDKGYLFFTAEPVEVGIEDNFIDLEIRIQEGIQAYINNVIIKGNLYTHDYVIRRELRTLPGNPFNRAELFRSQRELAMLNLFDPAKTSITPIPNPEDNTVDLLYEVQESPKFEFKFSGGWGGGNQPPTFNIALGTNNFSLLNALKRKLPLGDAQTVDLRVELYGKNQQNFVIQFADPWLGGKKPNAFSLALNKSYQRGKDQHSLSSMGLRASLGTKLQWPDDYCSIKNSFDYQRHQYHNYDFWDNDHRINGIMNDLHLTTIIKRSNVDSPIYPQKGSEIGLHVQMTPPYSWLSIDSQYKSAHSKQYKWKEYHQWILDGSYFRQLIGKLVLNIRGHFGLLGSYTTRQEVGPFERFVMGGTGLTDHSLVDREFIALRGYPDEYIKPKDHQGYHGGTIFDKLVAELRHPIVQSPLAYIYALAFAEAGNTWLSYQDWRLFDVKRSIGLGLRAYLPFLSGEIGIDWGYGFDKASSKEEKLVLHWSLGGGLR